MGAKVVDFPLILITSKACCLVNHVGGEFLIRVTFVVLLLRSTGMAIDGVKIVDSDFAWDIFDDFFERFDAGASPAALRRELIEEYEGEILSALDRELFLTTLAECLWSVGEPVVDLADQIQDMLDPRSDGGGMARPLSGTEESPQTVSDQIEQTEDETGGAEEKSCSEETAV